MAPKKPTCIVQSCRRVKAYKTGLCQSCQKSLDHQLDAMGIPRHEIQNDPELKMEFSRQRSEFMKSKTPLTLKTWHSRRLEKQNPTGENSGSTTDDELEPTSPDAQLKYWNIRKAKETALKTKRQREKEEGLLAPWKDVHSETLRILGSVWSRLTQLPDQLCGILEGRSAGDVRDELIKAIENAGVELNQKILELQASADQQYSASQFSDLAEEITEDEPDGDE